MNIQHKGWAYQRNGTQKNELDENQRKLSFLLRDRQNVYFNGRIVDVVFLGLNFEDY